MATASKMRTDEVVALCGCSLTHGPGGSEELFQMGLDLDPDFVAQDAGSCDCGPAFLGSGEPMGTRIGLKQSLDIMVRGTRAKNIPLIIGSVGIAGAWPQVLLFRDIIEEVAREQGLHFRIALINSDVDKGWLKGKVRAGKVKPLAVVPPLTEGEVERSCRIVAMMGVEPIIQALEGGADVIVAGRSSDSALFAAIPIMRGFDPGFAWHAGKIIECGALCTQPVEGVTTSVLARIRKDHFVIEPTHPEGLCTVPRVAAHTLYENLDPYLMPEPGAITDASESEFEQVRNGVKVSGSRHIPQPYTVKLEGAEMVGYRTITIASIRDPYLLSRIDEFLERGEAYVHRGVAGLGISSDDYKFFYRVYGKGDETMRPWNLKEVATSPREVCIIGECIAKTQEMAKTVMNFGHLSLLHQQFPGQLCSAGSAAFPFSPHDIDMGAAYRFNIWHVVELDDPLETFSIEMVDV